MSQVFTPDQEERIREIIFEELLIVKSQIADALSGPVNAVAPEHPPLVTTADFRAFAARINDKLGAG